MIVAIGLYCRIPPEHPASRLATVINKGLASSESARKFRDHHAIFRTLDSSKSAGQPHLATGGFINMHRKGIRGLAVVLASLFVFSILAGIVPPSSAPLSNASATTIPNTESITFRVPVTDDAYVDSHSPNTNYGHDSILFVVYDGSVGLVQHTWIKLDIASLPANLIIDSAKFCFYVEEVYNTNFSVRGFGPFYIACEYADSDWNESTITWNTEPTVGFGWNYMGSTTMQSVVPGTLEGLSDPVNETDADQYFFAYYTQDCTATVKDWYSGVLPNYGFMMRCPNGLDGGGPSSQQRYVMLQSKDPITWPLGYALNPPYLEVTGHSKNTQVHLSYYDSFTGEGIAPWTFNVTSSISGSAFQRITPDLTQGLFGQNLTIAVKDFFGNELYNQTRMITEASYYWDVGLPVYNYKFYNQNPQFSLLRIHYNLAGAPYSEFIPPYDYVARYLKAGTYRFNITFYNASGYAGNTYTWIRTIPSMTFPGAGFVILEGDTISEVITNVYGLKAVVQVIADLVTPNLIWVGLNMPQVPAYLMTVPNAVIFNNRYLVDSETTQTETGWLLNFSTPIPADVTVSSLIRDDFRFVGNLSTQIYVNTTSATAYSNATLPASISLANLTGGSYTIWTNRTISALRDTHFRWQRAFTYDYFPATDQYRAEITFQNSVGVQWRNLTLFTPLQNNSKVNNASVRVYDMNNTVDLTEGINFVLSKTGVHMWFPAWNASLWRGFTITYTTVNESEYQIPARVTVNQLGDGATVTMTWQSESFYYATATWTNAFREVYDGPFYITLELAVSVDPKTVIVLGESGIVVTSAVVYGNTIVIPSIHIDVGSKVVYTVLFQSTSAGSPMDLTFAGLPVIFVAIAVMIAAFIIGVVLYVFQKDERVKQFGRMLVGVAVLAMGVIAIVIIFFIVTTGA